MLEIVVIQIFVKRSSSRCAFGRFQGLLCIEPKRLLGLEPQLIYLNWLRDVLMLCTRVWHRLVESSFLPFCPILSRYHTVPAQLVVPTLYSGHCLSSDRCIYLLLFPSCTFYFRLVNGHLVWSRVTWLGVTCFVTVCFRFIAHIDRVLTFP